jgi:[ribosomal protein S5]-alanine N-acetyltransferase
MRTPILETQRLILRPLCVGDAEEIYHNWACDPEVAKFMTWSVHENVQFTRDWLVDVEKRIDGDEAYDWGFVRKADHALIGSGGIYYKEDRGMFTLGYNIMKSCWNQGYMTEAAAEILEFATKVLHQNKLFAYHAKDNLNSGKVMEKVGFHYVKDTEYDSMDGTRHFEAREYLFDKDEYEVRQKSNQKLTYKKYSYEENVIDTALFEKDRLTFAVLTWIVNNKSRLVITDHKRFVICHSEFPHPVWIWTIDDLTQEELSEIWACVEKELPAEEEHHFNTKYKVADFCVNRSKQEGRIPFAISMNMCTFDCQEAIAPTKRAEGRMSLATEEEFREVAVFLWEFKQDTGIDIETKEQCVQKAKDLIETGRLFLWKDAAGENVAMCSFRNSEPIGCVTHVYTKPQERRKGYAGSLVYEVTCIIKKMGLLPVLYTDADYKASNECYKKIGYVLKGSLCTIAAGQK